MKFQLTIARKLFGLSVLAVLFMVAVGVAGLYARHFLTIGADRVLAAQEVLQQQMQASQAREALRGDVLAALLASSEVDPARLAAVRAEAQGHLGNLRDALQRLEAADLDAPTRAALAGVRPALEAYAAQAARLVGASLEQYRSTQEQLPAFMQAYKGVGASMGALSTLIQQRARAAEAESRAISDQAGHVVTVFLVVSGLALLAIAWGISRSIVGRLAAAVRVARTVATGDLRSRIRVEGSDEAAQLLAALATMNQNLLDLVGTVRQSSEDIAAGSTQIANGNQDLSQRTEEQASNVQQTAASMEEISATVRANAETARAASEIATSARVSAAHSGAAVQELVATMGRITESSRRVADIVGVIDGIAFQTNILALNAAVEAARAGDQGRGFAVVASEVRALAQRSAAAAKEIKDLIADSVSRVEAGERQATHAGESMGDVVRQVERMAELSAEIGAATEEQTRGIVEVSQSVTRIDQVTQSNASLVEEATAAADSLNQQALRLVEAVSRFRLDAAMPDHRPGLKALPA